MEDLDEKNSEDKEDEEQGRWRRDVWKEVEEVEKRSLEKIEEEVN